MKTKFSILLFLLIGFKQLSAQAPNLNFVPIITTGLVSPVFITNCNDERLFIVEQDGRIRIKHTGVTALDTFVDINPRVTGGSGSERGLLSMAFHPDYKQNGYFYVYYTAQSPSGNLTISRFSVNPLDSNKADATSELILISIPHPAGNHNGGQLRFGPDGYLYAGTGDGGGGNDPDTNAQNITRWLGKMLRIDVNNGVLYSIPSDNPFINIPNARDEIWAYGLRNPWRFSFDRLTGDLWIGDVGQGAWEEVNFQPAGTGRGDNYGWRCWEGNHATGLGGCAGIPNQHPPVYEYSHSVGYSITGGYVYRGAQFSNLFGHYLFVDYGNSQFQSLIDNGAGGFTHYNLASLSGGNAFISSFGEDMYGELYVAGVSSGDIFKIEEDSCLPVAFIAFTDTLNICDTIATLSTPLGQNFIYQWTDSAGIAIGTSNTLTVTQNGWYHVTTVNQAFCTNSDSVYVNILGAPPAASFSGLDTFYCSYNAGDTLIGVPAGGVFIGSGIIGSVFNPDSAGLGIYIITYNYTDSNGCVSSSSSTIRVDACVAVKEINGVGVMDVYPNPAKDLLHINLDAVQNQNIALQITDLAGRIVQQKNISLTAGKNQITLNIQKLDAGIYLLNLNIEGTSLSRKFVVEK